MVKLEMQADVFEFAQPFLVVVVQLLARPVDGFGGVGVEAFQRFIAGAIFVVVALDAGDVHGPDDVQAFLGIGIVADDIAQAGDMRAFLFLNILQNHLERLQIGVDIGDNGVLHFLVTTLMRNFKTAKFIFCLRPIRLFLADESAHFRFADGLEEGFQFLSVAPSATNSTRPSGKLRTVAGHFKPVGQGFDRVSEPNALNMTGV